MNLRKLHQKAMMIADEAFLASKVEKDEEKAKELYLEAAKIEAQVASSYDPVNESEPSRSILFRSSASLAYQGGDYEWADRLVSDGLRGYPPVEIENELRDLYDTLNFMRHARAQGIEIGENGFLLTVNGQETQHGGVVADHVIKRLGKIQNVFYRTVERLMGHPFRRKGGIKKEIKEGFNLYLSTQFASSFGVHILVGTPTNQLEMFPDFSNHDDITAEQVVNEVVDCLRFLETNNVHDLKEKISDEIYYDNFVEFAKQIAPDGEKISTVSLIVKGDGQDTPLALRKTKKGIQESLRESGEESLEDEDGESFEFEGLVISASTPARGKFGTIKLKLTSTGEDVSIKVPVGVMKDTVQVNYEEHVKVSTTKNGKKYIYEDIQSI